MQNLALDVIEKIYFANEIYIGKGGESNAEKRLSLQHQALTDESIIYMGGILPNVIKLRNNWNKTTLKKQIKREDYEDSHAVLLND